MQFPLSLIPIYHSFIQGINKGVTAKKLMEKIVPKDEDFDFSLCLGFAKLDPDLVTSFEEIALATERRARVYSFLVTIRPKFECKYGFYLYDWDELYGVLAGLYGESSYSGHPLLLV